MSARDAPIRRAVETLEPDGLIAVGDYVVQGNAEDPKLQFPKISYDNNEVEGDSEFTCYWHTPTGVLIYVPDGSDVEIE